MRAKDFLLEYDRSAEQQRIEKLPVYQQRLKQDPNFSLEKLESGDPTPQKIYVPRLAQWWLAGEPIEDLISTTADALAKYHTLKLKKKIKPEHADIGKFKTADQFTSVMAQYELPTEEKPQDRGKYKEIHRDSELIVVQLLDKTAAMWWGKSTKWCTAAKKNNMFGKFSKDGPLFVIIPRKDPPNKYQYWWDKRQPYNDEFKTVLNKEIDPRTLSFFDKLQPIMQKVSPNILWNPNPTEKEQMAAVKQDGGIIRFIKNPTEQVQLAALQNQGFGEVIKEIENPSEAVQLAAIEEWPYSIRYIANPTEKAQILAVNKKLDAIYYIENPSEKTIKAAINHAKMWGFDDEVKRLKSILKSNKNK